MLTPIKIEVENNFVNFRYEGSDDIIYKTQKNIFQENTGVTISNPDINIPAYILTLSAYGTNINCGHIIDNLIGFLKNVKLENIFLIIDFSGVVQVSENFIEQYIKFILSSKSKILSINQNTNITNAIAQYVESIIDIQEVTV